MKFHRLIEWWDGKNLMHVSATDEHSREAAFKEALEGAIESGWYPPKWWDISRWYEGFWWHWTAEEREAARSAVRRS
jgi:hypothetical protein